jgi:RNA polymerase sigma factor (sigma-70 family)
MRAAESEFEEVSDETLMLRYCADDLSAFKELYRRHSRGLYRFLSWRVPRRDWIDEIMQDAWISLHRTRNRYEPRASFRVYLYQIARNRLIDLLRQQQPVLATDLVKDDEDGDVLSRFDEDAPAAQQEMELERRQAVAQLHAAIRALPVEQKEALVLQQFNGMSLEEIASFSAVPVETVKSRLRYAMQKLRKHFTEERVEREPQA